MYCVIETAKQYSQLTAKGFPKHRVMPWEGVNTRPDKFWCYISSSHMCCTTFTLSKIFQLPQQKKIFTPAIKQSPALGNVSETCIGVSEKQLFLACSQDSNPPENSLEKPTDKFPFQQYNQLHCSENGYSWASSLPAIPGRQPINTTSHHINCSGSTGIQNSLPCCRKSGIRLHKSNSLRNSWPAPAHQASSEQCESLCIQCCKAAQTSLRGGRM